MTESERSADSSATGARAPLLERLLGELDRRNLDNVSRTASYLELYSITRDRGPELPWLLMAHLVSRNAGYMMVDLAKTLDPSGRRARSNVFAPRALTDLFLFLERANYLIFHDAWHHVLHHLLGRSDALSEGRVARFMRQAWQRYEATRADVIAANASRACEIERSLVLDLVTNEQNYIEHRVVHAPSFEAPRAIISFIETIGREAPMVLPISKAQIVVGGFSRLEQRIAVGTRIFDEVLADRPTRDAIFVWATDHPHTGARSVYGGPAGPTLREAWPLERVEALSGSVHAPPEPDSRWP